jgi:hypothetical protein
MSVFKSSDSSIWSGTYGGGAFKYKNKKFTRCFWEQGISESIIKSIAEDNNGNILIRNSWRWYLALFQKRILESNCRLLKTISETNNLTSNYVSYVYKASNGAIVDWLPIHILKVDRVILNKDFTYSITSFPITELVKF